MHRILLVAVLLLTACSETLQVAAPNGGSCLACHDGISDMHPAFALSCVDCHGGNDAVTVPASVDVRDQQILRASHVLPKEPELWWANGADDDDDGEVDEDSEFFRQFEFDNEMNRDVNYLRFINPGDLRVAEVSCGGRNRNALNEAMVCHAEVVYDVRRSIMATNAGVTAGALYGNAQLPVAADFGAAFAASPAGLAFDGRDARIGRAGYAFDFDAIDVSYDRERNVFDADAIADKASADCNVEGTANCDVNDVGFEALAGPLFDDGSAADPFGAPLDPGRGKTRTGRDLSFPDRSVDVLQYVANRENRVFPPVGSSLELRLQKILGLSTQVTNGFDGRPLTNPVDAALRSFRAFHFLTFMDPSDNFANGGLENNPFGRFGSSGCTACHVEYGRDGKNVEPKDRTVADNGRQPETDLPLGIRIDKGQRAYAKLHQLKTAVPTETCANCHGFVTRVALALEGKFELETDLTNLETVQTLATAFLTPAGSTVEIFDNLANFEDGALVNAGEAVTEDLNNNGELDVGEDANGDGVLQVPDRVARSRSFDGRQSKLVYGGANGSTHLVDVHVEVGMACSDCHVTSVHGDSNIYTRNWDAEPLECDDCHGTPSARANLTTSGPNGGDALNDPIWRTPFGKPWFEESGGQVIEHSRTRAGLSWIVPQLVDEVAGTAETGRGHYAHNQRLESAPVAGEERALAHIADSGGKGGLECYTCHSSWQPNCLTCHLKMDVSKARQEIWFGNGNNEDIFFQLFSYTRSPFYLGRAGDVEGNKVAPYRSTMQVHLSVVNGESTVVDNVMMSSANSLSSLASNPYFPHTVRETETKSCARCHTLVDDQSRIANDHLLAEASGQGSGRYMNIGDFVLAATGVGLEQMDIKAEPENKPGVSFPGFDLSDVDPRSSVDFPTPAATDIALLRGVAFVNGSSDVADVAIVAHAGGASIIDVTGRDNAGLPPTSLGEVDGIGAVTSVDVIDTAASHSRRFIAATADEVCTVEFVEVLEPTHVANVLDGGAALSVSPLACVGHQKTGVTRVRLHGRFALLAHDAGVSVVELGDGPSPSDLGEPLGEVATFSAPGVVDVASSGRFIYAAAGAGGVVVFDAGPLLYPLFAPRDPSTALTVDTEAVGAIDAAVLQTTPDCRGIALQGSHLLIAGGVNGLHIVDVAVPADPVLERTIRDIDNGVPLDDANAVVVAATPTRNYAVVADGQNGVRVVNITPQVDFRTRLAEVAADPNAPGNRGFRLSNERADPLTPFDAKNDNLDASAVAIVTGVVGTAPFRNIFTFPTDGPALALAKGLSFDNIADKSGRPLRDSWSIGSTPLDQDLVARMRSVIVSEVDPTDARGDGLGCIVRIDDDPGQDCTPTIAQ
jgi:hypothetical protein